MTPPPASNIDECIGDSRTLLINPVDGASSAPPDGPIRLMLAFKIEKIRELMNVARPGQYLVSQPSSSPLAPQLVWKLRLYPNGSCEEKAGYISIYLWQIGIVDQNSSLPATFRIYLLDASGSETTICGGDVTFHAGQREWGKSTVPRQLLLNVPKKGEGAPLIHGDGSLMVVCEVSHPRQLTLVVVTEEQGSETTVTGVKRRGERRCACAKDCSVLIDQLEASTREQVTKWKRLLKKPQEIQSRQDELYAELFSPSTEGKIQLQLTDRGKCHVLLDVNKESGLVRQYHRVDNSTGFVCTECSSFANRAERVHVRVKINGDGKIQAGAKDHNKKCVGNSKAAVIKTQLARRIKLWEKENSNVPGRASSNPVMEKEGEVVDDPVEDSVTPPIEVPHAEEEMDVDHDDGGAMAPLPTVMEDEAMHIHERDTHFDAGDENGSGDEDEISIAAASIDPSVRDCLY